MKEILIVTGLSAVGKTTILTEANKTLGYRVSAERALIHELSVSHGYSHTREWLKDAGLPALLKEAREVTLAQIKSSIDDKGMIIDGGYDSQLPNLLRADFSANRLLIISIIASCAKRESFMMKRLNSSLVVARQEMVAIDQPKKEAGVEEVMKRADLVITNEGLVKDAVAAFLEGISALSPKTGF